MKKNKNEQYHDPWDRDFYETGSTQPPREKGGLIAFLLVLVVLLGGLASLMGIVNVRLLQQLAAFETEPDRLELFEEEVSGGALRELMIPVDETGALQMGMEFETVSDFDRKFYELPRGVLITHVDEGSCAELAGIRSGDVIISLGEHPICSEEELMTALSQCPGKLQLHFYRQQTKETLSVNVTVSKKTGE